MSPDDAVQVERPLRADAVRNRELILETAADVFAEHGLDASYDEIARRAGIGVGTVYRRFPERIELAKALFESRIAEIVTLAQEAVDRPDAFAALVWFMERALERQVADRGLKQVMALSISEDDHRSGGRDIGPLVQALVGRAQADGSMRADVSSTDIGWQVMSMSCMSTPAQPDLWRRYLALFVDGLRARPDLRPLPLQAPPDEAMHDLMGNMQRG